MRETNQHNRHGRVRLHRSMICTWTAFCLPSWGFNFAHAIQLINRLRLNMFKAPNYVFLTFWVVFVSPSEKSMFFQVFKPFVLAFPIRPRRHKQRFRGPWQQPGRALEWWKLDWGNYPKMALLLPIYGVRMWVTQKSNKGVILSWAFGISAKPWIEQVPALSESQARPFICQK